jgi:crystallin alpha B
MALLPSLWRDMDDFYTDPWRLHRELVPSWRRPWFDDFGFGLYPYDWNLPKEFRQVEQKFREMHRRMWDDFPELGTIDNSNGFKVCVDVQQFKPYEITVRTDNNVVTVEGRHDERKDSHGFVSRQFSRRYTLPANCNPYGVSSELSSDGVLTIKAPPKVLPPPRSERTIRIEHTGPVKAIKAN